MTRKTEFRTPDKMFKFSAQTLEPVEELIEFSIEVYDDSDRPEEVVETYISFDEARELIQMLKDVLPDGGEENKNAGNQNRSRSGSH